jgi:hypothetical protein
MIRFAKIILRPVRDSIRSYFIEKKLKARIKNRAHATLDSFKFEDFKRDIIVFVRSNQVNETHYLHKYSASCTKPTLYASAYALMTLSLLGELEKLSDGEKEEWRNYFDSFQNESDGLFYDPAVQNEIYYDTDWWGARHLALHMISAYTDLGFRPKYSFAFLKKYYKPTAIQEWLDQFDWQSASIGAEDVDNKIMNIGCLLQYQRDYWEDAEAAQAIEFLKKYLRSKINKQTGMWGFFDIAKPHQRSRMVQFAYHLLPIFFHDQDFDFNAGLIVTNVLNTQNKYGGYGVQLNSSACEDIDSIYLLIRLRFLCDASQQIEIEVSLKKAFSWIFLNQMEGGGFVFRLFEGLKYGHQETSSIGGQGGMFPTWFRLLSIAYLVNSHGSNAFVIKNSPGYSCWCRLLATRHQPCYGNESRHA